MFGLRISLKTLAVLCRSLGTMLHSGVPLLRALETVSRKTGDMKCRKTLADVRVQVSAGFDLAAAMRQQRGYYPDLTCDMIEVAEHTGMLPEVLESLAGHYENIVRLRRMFLGIITWPAIQLFAAIMIVALMIFVLGIIGEGRGGPIDMLGWGLTGTKGAITWLVLSLGSVAGIVGSYFLVANVFRQKRFLDGLLMRIPVVGGCMRAFAIARFSWAFALTQQTGMPIQQSLDASFRATNNGAFAGASRDTCERVMAGDELGIALADSRLFPDEYIQIVHVAETSGTVPETLERLSPQFEDQARRSLAMLATALGGLVWLAVAGLIVFIVISIFLRYVGVINDALKF